MDWVTDKIAIGDNKEAQELALLQQEGISSILGLIQTLRGREPS